MAVKKVTAFVGAARKGYTYRVTREFLDQLEASGGVETELVRLSDYHLEPCRGCKACFAKGEEFSRLKDDRDALLAKMKDADGVVFASPNYSFQVSALMKLFLDRLGYVCHRPQFHRKAFTSIVVQGFFGGDKILKYFDLMGTALESDVVKGTCSTALVPMTDKERKERNAALRTGVIFTAARRTGAKAANAASCVGSWGSLHESARRLETVLGCRPPLSACIRSGSFAPNGIAQLRYLVRQSLPISVAPAARHRRMAF